jgi:hypothetical protein
LNAGEIFKQVKQKEEVVNQEKQDKWVSSNIDNLILMIRNDNEEKYSWSYNYWNKGLRRY